MATLIREIPLTVSAESAWFAVQDVAAVHRRLAPGLVTDVKLENGVREVTFANGLVIQELIVSIDHPLRRLAYTALNRAKHHHATMQVFAENDGRCRFVWITDVFPDDVAGRFAAVMDQAMPIIAHTLQSGAAKT